MNRINNGNNGNENSLLIEAGEMDTSASNTTGRVVMVNKTMTMLKGLLFDPFDEFNGGKKKNDETSRLSAYADRKRRERKANRCAEIIASIPPVDNPTLKGAAKKAADERISPLERRVQSLEDRANHLNSKGSERNNAARKQTKSRDKPSNQQKKGGKGKNGRGDKNNDSGGGKGRRGKGHSAKESNARQRNSRTEMRK